MDNQNKVLTTSAAAISLFVSVILFIVVIFAAQIFLPRYFFETSDYYLLVILMEIIPLGAGVLIYLYLTKQQLSDIIHFNKPQAKENKKNMLWLVLLGAGMALFGRMFLSGLQVLWVAFLDAVGFNVAEPSFPPVDSLGVFFWALVGVAVSPAIFEELIFRGILQKGLLRSSKPKTAIIISSVIFMLMHLSVESLVFTFACGCLLGYMAYKSGSILPSMAFHFVNNSIAVFGLYVLQLLGNDTVEEASSLVQSGAENIIFLTIYGIISFILLAVALWGFAKLAKSPPANPYKKPLRPAALVLIVLSACILFAVLAITAAVQNILPV
ncbi:MAG: CPBP family intramembrane metalloprotease [Clostridia bacterium]|nr:CPBP family intramembrane metalloprotease [Clostridia bacterium]